MGVCDESDRAVSTPGAPNIRIVPSIVPVQSDDVSGYRSARPKRHDGHSPTASILDTGSNARVVAFRR